MFQVKHKQTGELRTVYGFTGVSFLFWNHEEACWEYGDTDHYAPVGVPQ